MKTEIEASVTISTTSCFASHDIELSVDSVVIEY